MPVAEFTLALLALLVTPGPTNTLLALAGAERGFFKAIRFIPAEVAAYLATTIPMAVIGASLLDNAPSLRAILTLAASGWVAYLAIRLWRLPTVAEQAAGQITFARVFVTTLLNPKAFIIGLVFLPGTDGLVFRAGLFALLIIGVATGWALVGSMLRSDRSVEGNAIHPLVRRAGACWLGLVSFSLATAAGIQG